MVVDGASWTLLKTSSMGALPSVIISVLVLCGVLFFEPKPEVLIVVMVLFSLCWEAVSNYRKKLLPRGLDIVKRQIVMVFFILLTIYITAFFGGYGLIGIAIIVLSIAGITLYRRWDVYMKSVRHIETLIWGEPLDKKKR